MTVEWRPSFAIGEAGVDGQHREIFLRLERLLQAIEAGKGEDEVCNTLDFLEQYTREHFAEEEALQRRTGYPHFEMHQAEHRHFLETLAAIRAKYLEKGSQEEVVKWTSRALQDWLVKHICEIDKAFARYHAQHPPGD